MPELRRFLGIVISMYYRNHGRPYFHAYHGAFQATVDIEASRMNVSLPARVTARVQEWRLLHQAELPQNWDLARDQLPLPRIAPLE